MARKEIKELAKQCDRSIGWVYLKAKELGRLPSLEELLKLKKVAGRQKKY